MAQKGDSPTLKQQSSHQRQDSMQDDGLKRKHPLLPPLESFKQQKTDNKHSQRKFNTVSAAVIVHRPKRPPVHRTKPVKSICSEENHTSDMSICQSSRRSSKDRKSRNAGLMLPQIKQTSQNARKPAQPKTLTLQQPQEASPTMQKFALRTVQRKLQESQQQQQQLRLRTKTPTEVRLDLKKKLSVSSNPTQSPLRRPMQQSKSTGKLLATVTASP